MAAVQPMRMSSARSSTDRGIRRCGALVAALFLTCTACGNGGVVMPQRPRTEVPEPPQILSMTADPATIVEGETTQLSWDVNDSNAALKLAPLGLAVVGDSIEVSPVVTTTYTLTATNAVGITFRNVTVSVVPQSADAAPDAPAEATAEWVVATANLAGQPSQCGTLTSVSADPASGQVIAGVAGGGLWVLGPDGAWSVLGQSPGSDPVVNRPNAVVWDPDNPFRFWESGAYGGVAAYRTDDAGQTFTRLGNLDHAEFISIDFSDPQRQTILAGAHESSQFYRSTNGGQSWDNLANTLPDGIGWAESPLFVDEQTYLLGSRAGSASGVYRSTDRGASWARIIEYPVVGRPAVVESEHAIYWLLDGQQGMIRSVDGGQNWKLLKSGPGSGNSKSVLMLPDGRIATIGAGGVITTSDQGKSWHRLGPVLPFDPHGLTYSVSLNAFFAWHFDCPGDNAVVADDSIIRLDLDQPLTPAATATVTSTATATTG
jgi:hypothetical protein